MEFFGIVAQVQRNELEQEAERVKLDRDQRKALRLQENGQGMTAGELLAKLSGSSAELSSEAAVEETEEVPREKSRGGGFPPPPNCPTGNASSSS